MGTRQDLEREREALVGLAHWVAKGGRGESQERWNALTASIARLDALLSLSDAMAGEVADIIADASDMEEEIGEHACAQRVAAYRAVASIVRRTS